MAELKTLRITEIFHSLQGESTRTGLPTVFIRLTGCPLRCEYCDTAYAFSGGEVLSLDDIIDQVKGYQTRYVTVTGGEPLAQKNCMDLLERLCDQGYSVSLETSGAMDVSGVNPKVIKIMDVKTPASGEEEKNRVENLKYLNPHDEIKFVICNRQDYEWAKSIMEKHQLAEYCEVLFSPVAGDMAATELAEWILEDGLSVRFQLQLHKILWDDGPGH